MPKTAQEKLKEQFIQNNLIDKTYYDKYGVKRGLRNPDGTGVMAGVTNICNVHGYIVNEGEKEPVEGKLFYRGYNVVDIVSNAQAENRFGFEEVVFLLLFGTLPNKSELKTFRAIIDAQRELPNDFFEDMI